MGAASVRIEHLSHRYPGARRLALDDVGFDVEPGQRVGLLGPNGAGKSTLMRLVCGYLPVGEAKTIDVGGLDVRRQSRRVRAGVGYMPEHVPLYYELRAVEHLAFRATIKRVPRGKRRAEIERVAGLTGITDVLHTPIGQLSRGYRQRVGLADALLGAPPLVILDEPTVGLDPNQVRDVRAMLRDLGGTQTLLFSSHILAEVEMLCDRVVILSQGKVVADESIAQATTATHVDVVLEGERAAAEAVLRKAGADPDASTWQAHAAGWAIEVRLEPEHDADAMLATIGAAAVAGGVVPRRLARGTTRLEERFAEVTGARGLDAADDDDTAEGAEEDDDDAA